MTGLSIVAPFFTDIDISQGTGQILYEVHTEATSSVLLSQVDAVIEPNFQTEFNGRWLLVATWDGVPPFGGDLQTVRKNIRCISI